MSTYRTKLIRASVVVGVLVVLLVVGFAFSLVMHPIGFNVVCDALNVKSETASQRLARWETIVKDCSAFEAPADMCSAIRPVISYVVPVLP